MSDKVFEVYYIDDQIAADSIDPRSRLIAEVIGAADGLICSLKPPPPDIGVVDGWGDVDALLVDLDLRTADKVNYFGSSLAAEMRVRHPACPIILTTGQAEEPWRVRILEERGEADLIWFKDEILGQSEAFVTELRDLIEGFQVLNAVEVKDARALMELIAAQDEEEQRQVGETGLPLKRRPGPPVKDREPGDWSVSGLARWLRTVLLKYPGVLYDELTAATRLGVTQESFRRAEVQALFESARYTGPLAAKQGYWWRDRLLDLANEVIFFTKTEGVLADAFAQAFEEKYKQTLELAVCVVDGKPGADWVCHLLRVPVRVANSLAYYPDTRPSVMEQARVSFTSIRESRDFDVQLVHPADQEIVERLWNGETLGSQAE